MYYFFLNDVLLPVPPPSMNVRYKNRNQTISLINDGEINVIRKQGLQEVSFEIMLPNKWYPFAQYNSASSIATSLLGGSGTITYAKNFLSDFEQLKVNQAPFRLIIVRMDNKFNFLGDTNLLVTLEDYSVNEDADKSGFDFQVPLKFKQYQPYGTKELEIETDENGQKVANLPQVRETTKEIPRAYTTAANMSVLEACRMAAGGQLDWRAVAVNNNIFNANDVAKGTLLNFWEQ